MNTKSNLCLEKQRLKSGVTLGRELEIKVRSSFSFIMMGKVEGCQHPLMRIMSFREKGFFEDL